MVKWISSYDHGRLPEMRPENHFSGTTLAGCQSAETSTRAHQVKKRLWLTFASADPVQVRPGCFLRILDPIHSEFGRVPKFQAGRLSSSRARKVSRILRNQSFKRTEVSGIEQIERLVEVVSDDLETRSFNS